MLMPRKIGATLVDMQMVGIARLVDRVGLVNFCEQAGAGAETDLEVEVARRARPTRQPRSTGSARAPAR
jgi:hypothetical protein